MKLTIAFIITGIIILSCGVFAQNSSSSEEGNASQTDIKALVQKQIAEIKKKEQTHEKPVRQVAEKEEVSKTGNSAAVDSLIMKGFILFQTTLIAALFILWRRSKRELRKYHKSKLKNNIRNMREEKVKTSHNPKLATLRSSLGNEAKRMHDFRKDITKQAKRYSIAKGEVHLAAKLNMMTEQK
jgi:hypothetical protein